MNDAIHQLIRVNVDNALAHLRLAYESAQQSTNVDRIALCSMRRQIRELQALQRRVAKTEDDQ